VFSATTLRNVSPSMSDRGSVKTLTGHGLEKKGVQALSSDFDGINGREHDDGTAASHPIDTLTSMKKETQRS